MPRGSMPWRAFQARQEVTEIGDRFVSHVAQGNGDPVIFIHGIPTWGYLWQGLMATLPQLYRMLGSRSPRIRLLR